MKPINVPGMLEAKERFLSQLSSVVGGCRYWQGRRDSCDYGEFRLKRISYKANRVAYFFHYGVDPGESNVLHTCDRPSCCEPTHLFLGTHQENMLDKKEKGRAQRLIGEENPNNKLSDTDVENIRIMLGDKIKQIKIAEMFKISQSHVSAIKRRKLWKDI